MAKKLKTMEIGKMMLYPNGYININQNGEYTKHYYADALRIASKIGSGFSQNLCDEANQIGNLYPDYLDDRMNKQHDEMMEELTELINGNQITDINPIPYPEADLCNLSGSGIETALFFYHPDHLGSTGMVTDNSSNITQGFLYTPFGELLYEYDPGWESGRIPKYSFNAKELDEENGMYYYSARYYAPPTFISRDPMFEKYPSISPYAYCANNPMKYVDPTGMDNVIYLVDLQKGKKIIDPNKLIIQANQYFKDLGLKTRVALAPKDFDPSKMDETDSYAVISNDGKQAAAWINKNDPNANKYQIKFDGFGFSGNEPELSSNTFGLGTVGQKTDAIALDAQSISDWAGNLGVSTTEYAALSILHGAGHNVNFNHSTGDFSPRHGQDKYNCGIMVSGNYLLNNKANYKELISKDRNSTYINVMKKDNYFGNNTAKTYWGKIIK